VQSTIEKVISAIHDNDLPIVYLLGEKYVTALLPLSFLFFLLFFQALPHDNALAFS
jgi:hypothetical protein